MHRRLLPLLPLFVLFGCSTGEPSENVQDATRASSSSGAPGGVTVAEKKMCDAIASRTSCDGGADTCGGDSRCIAALMLPAALDAFVACYGAPGCGREDPCATAAGRAVAGAAGDAYKVDCMQKWQTCRAGGVQSTFRNDDCDPGVFAGGTTVEAMSACIQKPCGEIDACFDAVPAFVQAAKCKTK